MEKFAATASGDLAAEADLRGMMVKLSQLSAAAQFVDQLESGDGSNGEFNLAVVKF